jgi:GntR family transcriptional regulator
VARLGEFLDGLRIEAGGVPIYVQLRQQYLRAIGSAVLRPGDQLPTMRQVAVTLRVNLSTVQQAYASLEQDGFIVTKRGRGTFVADHPPPRDAQLEEARLDGFAHQIIATALSQGFNPAALGRRILELASGAH